MTDTHSNNTIELQDQDPGFFTGLGISAATSFIESKLEDRGISVEFQRVGIAKDALYDAYTLVRDDITSTRSMVDYVGEIIEYVVDAKKFEQSGNETTQEEQEKLDQQLEKIQDRHPELSKLYQITPMEAVKSDNNSVIDVTARVGARLDDSESFIMRMNVDLEVSPPHIAVNFYKDGDFDDIKTGEKLEYIQDNFSSDLSFIQEASVGTDDGSLTDAKEAFQSVLDDANNEIGGEDASAVMIREAARTKLAEQTTIAPKDLATSQVDNSQTNTL